MNMEREVPSYYTYGYTQINPDLLITPIAIYERDERAQHPRLLTRKLGAYTTSLLEASGQLLDVTI